MSFKNILGQEYAKGVFRNILQKGCLAHAYIFSGPGGTGKSLFADEVTKSLNCIHMDGDVDPCDKCISCRKVDSETSSDVIKISLEKGRKLIGIKEIRTLQESAALKPAESDLKTFIINDTDKLSEEASNCLLKTLEEPPLSTLIILLVNSMEALPETIVSRCQVIRFFSLPVNVVNSYLQERFEVEKDTAEWISTFSGGSIGYATMVYDEGLFKKNELLMERLTKLTVEDNFSLSQEIHGWFADKETPEEKRSYLKIVLELFLSFYRDILILKTNSADEGRYLNRKQRREMEFMATSLNVDTLENIIDQILSAINNVNDNANTSFLLENLLTNIASI